MLEIRSRCSCYLSPQGDNRRGNRGGDNELRAEGASLGEHGHSGFYEKGLAHRKEVALQHAEGVGYVQAEADQSKVESAAATATIAARINGGRVERGEERIVSRSDEIGRDQHLRDGDYEAQKGQVARAEAQLVQLERQEHGQYNSVCAEYGQTAEREIARERRPETREKEGQQPRRRAALELRELERLVRERKGQYRQRDHYHHASAQVTRDRTSIGNALCNF